ncbi:MAG: SCO family protein [Flavobacteriales bacterium]
MKTKNIVPAIVVVLLIVFAIFYLSKGKPSGIVYKKLPFIGKHKLDTVMVDGKMRIDTLWHRIPEFRFINQEGREVTEQDVKGKIYVVDFFFTTCQTICPAMSDEMNRINQTFADEPNVLILSHTVDPDTDQPEQLKSYAEKFGAKSNKWLFLTGDKVDLYAIARNGYLLEASIGTGGPTDFIHTQNFALIDHNRRIRGIYDGLDKNEIDLLIKDIRSLLLEQKRS